MNYLKFWGVRGSYPAPFGSHMRIGGNTVCVELRVDDHILICDGGSGIIPLGNSLLKQKNIKEITILLTHYHWDHISGLPFFVPVFIPGWKLNIYGPGNSKEEIKKRISGQMIDPYFPIEVETWLADINYLIAHQSELEYGPFKMETFNVHHPGITLGYRITVHDKTIVYVSDNELQFINQAIEARENEFNASELEFMNSIQSEEREIALQYIKNADLLIHDAQYTPEDYKTKKGWGHSCYVDTVNFAMEANVKNLYLIHLDPNYDDDQAEEIHLDAIKILREHNSPIVCNMAREGLIIDIDSL